MYSAFVYIDASVSYGFCYFLVFGRESIRTSIIDLQQMLLSSCMNKLNHVLHVLVYIDASVDQKRIYF